VKPNRSWRCIPAAGLVLLLAACRDERSKADLGDRVADDTAQPTSTASAPAGMVAVPEVDVALLDDGTPPPFQLTVRAGDRVHVDFDTQGWEQAVDAQIEAEKRAPVHARTLTRQAEHLRAEGPGFRLDELRIEIGEPTHHVHLPLLEVLMEAWEHYVRFAEIVGHHDRYPTLLLVIEPGVDMGTVHDLLFTAGRAEIARFEVLLRTPAGLGRVPLELPPALESPFPQPCHRTTVTVASDGAFVSLAGTLPLVHDPTQTLQRIAAGVDPHSPLLAGDRRMLLDPERRCPTVAAKAGVIDLEALGQRLAELPSTDRCPAMPVAFERDVEWATAAPVLAKLTVDGHAPIFVHANCGWGEGWTDCSAGVRPGDPRFEVPIPSLPEL
jgi:hypothetical protein